MPARASILRTSYNVFERWRLRTKPLYDIEHADESNERVVGVVVSNPRRISSTNCSSSRRPMRSAAAINGSAAVRALRLSSYEVGRDVHRTPVGYVSHTTTADSLHSSLSRRLERPEANAIKRRHEQLSPASDRRPTNLFRAKRPEHHFGRPAGVVGVIARTTQIVHRCHSESIEKMLLLRAARTSRVERPMERDLIGRGRWQIKSSPNRRGRTRAESAGSPRSRPCRHRELEARLESPKPSSFDSPGVIRAVGSGTSRAQRRPSILSEACLSGPSLLRRRAPIGMDDDLELD